MAAGSLAADPIGDPEMAQLCDQFDQAMVRWRADLRVARRQEQVLALLWRASYREQRARLAATLLARNPAWEQHDAAIRRACDRATRLGLDEHVIEGCELAALERAKADHGALYDLLTAQCHAARNPADAAAGRRYLAALRPFEPTLPIS